MSATQAAENQTCKTSRQPQFQRPQFRVTHNKEAYSVEIYAPGAAKDTVKVTIDQDKLSTTLERRVAAEPEEFVAGGRGVASERDQARVVDRAREVKVADRDEECSVAGQVDVVQDASGDDLAALFDKEIAEDEAL